MSSRVGHVLAACLAPAVLAAAGCGDTPKADVSGVVKFKGRPVVWGTVTVIASDQMAYHGSIHPDGKYTVKDVPIGPATVAVASADPYTKRLVKAEREAELAAKRKEAGMEDLPPPPKGMWVPLPARYANPRASELSCDVAQPETAFDIALK
jgi:hypothetical protein